MVLTWRTTSCSIESTDFPQSGTPHGKLAFLLNYAVLAPSILGIALCCAPTRHEDCPSQTRRAVNF